MKNRNKSIRSQREILGIKHRSWWPIGSPTSSSSSALLSLGVSTLLGLGVSPVTRLLSYLSSWSLFAQISIELSSVVSLNAHGNPARIFPPSTPHQGGDLVGYQVISSKCIFRTFYEKLCIFFFCNFVQDYSQLLRDILGGTKGHPLVARIL